jgi:RNA polymerase sigma factor (sigma-70 family)
MKPDNYYRNNENLRFKLTTPEEEKELFRKAKAGDTDSREFLIHNHLLFAATFARRQNRGKLPDSEIVSAANNALMSAIDKFDPERGNRFTRYLLPFLRGALASLWKEKNTVEKVARTNGEWPEFVSYAEDKKPDTENNRGGRKARKPIVDLAPAPDEVLADAEDLALHLATLAKGKAMLSKEEKELLRLIYEEKVTMADIARARGVSRQAVFAAHGQIVGKLRAGFEEEQE